MLTFLLDIEVRDGCEAAAVETLSAIQEHARSDAGCCTFRWTQHRDEPYHFTLFEQWDSQEHLDAHLNSAPGLWEQFVPCLRGEPRSTPVRPIDELCAPVTEAEADAFARDWFDRLNRHVPVEDILPLVADDGLEMAFPERTLHDHAEFRDWYADVGRSFREQDHQLEQVDVRPDAGGADVIVTVAWRATETGSGCRQEARAYQTWRLDRSFSTGEPLISKYRVRALVPLQ